MTAATFSHYEILGVAKTASGSEIKAAYRRMVRQAHPDTGGNEALFSLITEAYRVLGDESLRQSYDRNQSSSKFSEPETESYDYDAGTYEEWDDDDGYWEPSSAHDYREEPESDYYYFDQPQKVTAGDYFLLKTNPVKFYYYLFVTLVVVSILVVNVNMVRYADRVWSDTPEAIFTEWVSLTYLTNVGMFVAAYFAIMLAFFLRSRFVDKVNEEISKSNVYV